jgi:hypothetical protein
MQGFAQKSRLFLTNLGVDWYGRRYGGKLERNGSNGSGNRLSGAYFYTIENSQFTCRLFDVFLVNSDFICISIGRVKAR